MAKLSSGPLLVQFQTFHDRLSHAIGIQIQDTWVWMLESIEGTSLDAWPVSPPMQQMVSESVGRENSPVLFGVGLSGNGHWSMAIDAKEDGLLKLDIACKNSKSAAALGSVYRLAPKIECVQVGQTLKLRSNEHSLAMEIQTVMGELTWDASAHTIAIKPTSNPEKIQTHRWCFQVDLSNG